MPACASQISCCNHTKTAVPSVQQASIQHVGVSAQGSGPAPDGSASGVSPAAAAVAGDSQEASAAAASLLEPPPAGGNSYVEASQQQLRRHSSIVNSSQFKSIVLQIDLPDEPVLHALHALHDHCPMALGARQLGASAAPAFAAGWPTPPAQQPQCGACIGGWGSFGANASYCTMCSPGSYSPAAFSPACPACPLVRGTLAVQLA